jgi:2-keto-4-pentenoate hydratase/2-oxohepta-3-ene-1,7-dioic acid hydratase in catechol pathway
MRVVVFGDQRRVGALDGDRVVDLEEAFTALARDAGEEASEEGRARVPADLPSFIEGGAQALANAARGLERARTAAQGEIGPGGHALWHPAGQVRLRAPWPGRRIACAGGNYGDHLARMQANLEGIEEASAEEAARRARRAGQWGFWKVTDEVAGPDDDIPKPRRSELFDYEGEIAVVLGARGKDVTAAAAPGMVWGFTLLNDWSVRNDMGRPRPMSYNLAKNFDGCVSMGPAIAVGEGDFASAEVELRVNGELRQKFSTMGMIFSFGEIIENLSRDFSLLPGDVIAGGTAAGTAADSTKPGPGGERSAELYLKPGDVVELSSPWVGTLANRIVEP